MVTGFLAPEVSQASLSARSAPSVPDIYDTLRQLPPMQRRTMTDQLKPGDSLAALLARNGVSAVEADAALDSMRAQFDSRKLRPGQKVRLFHDGQPMRRAILRQAHLPVSTSSPSRASKSASAEHKIMGLKPAASTARSAIAISSPTR